MKNIGGRGVLLLTSDSLERDPRAQSSWRAQLIALRPKPLPIGSFHPILGELAGSTLSRDHNSLAVRAANPNAKFQGEAAGRARWRGTSWLSSGRPQQDALVSQFIYGRDPLRRKRPKS